jgi:hypothetical protein
MVVAPRTDGPVVVAPRADSPVVVAPRTDGPVVVAPRTDGPIVVAPGTDSPVVVAPHTDGPVVVAPRTDGPVVVTPRTYGPLVVATRAINPSNKTLKKGTTTPQRQLPPGFRRLGIDLQLVPRPAVHPVDPQIARNAMPPPNTQLPNAASQSQLSSQTLPPYNPDFPPFEPPLPPSSPGNWSDDSSQENLQLEHEQLPDGNVGPANGNYTFNSSCSIVPDSCAPVADTAMTSNATTSNATTSNTTTSNATTSNAITSNAVTPNAVTSNAVTSNAITSDTITSNAITSDTITSNIIGQPNHDATDTPPAVVPPKKARRPAKDKVSALQQPNVGRTTRGATAASKKRNATEAGLDETGDGVNTDLTAPAKRITRRANQGAS